MTEPSTKRQKTSADEKKGGARLEDAQTLAASTTVQLPSGAAMPLFGLGTYKGGKDEVKGAVKEAIRLGYRHIDCAAVYGNEKEIGDAFAEAFAEGLCTRAELFVTSKLWLNCFAPEDVKPACEQTLRDLRLDYVDLYLIHWPVAWKKNATFQTPADQREANVPIIDTWRAMEGLVGDGLAKDIGVSNFTNILLHQLLMQSSIKPACNQVEMHPYLPQAELLAYHNTRGVPLAAYCPLARPGYTIPDKPRLFDNGKVKAIAERLGATVGQVILRWGVQRGVAVVPKSTNTKRLTENLLSMAVSLSEEDMATLNNLGVTARLVATGPCAFNPFA